MGLEAKVPLQRGGVRIGHRHIPGLHGHQLFMGLKIVVLRQNTGTDQLFRQDLYKIQQVFRIAVADVIHRVGGNGQAVFPGLLLRRLPHHPEHTLHNVIDVGEIPLAVSVVEDFDGLSRPQLVGKAKVGHVRPSGRSVNGEEPQAGGGNVVELAVGVGQQLIAFFGGRVQRNGIVHLVLRGIGHLFVGAVDGRRGSVHQMLHRVMAAGFQNIVKAQKIALHIGIRIDDGIPHSCLGRQIHHNCRMIGFKQVKYQALVRQVSLDEHIVWKSLQFLQPGLLDAHIIVIIHIVQADDPGIRCIRQNSLCQVGADKAGGSGDQYTLIQGNPSFLRAGAPHWIIFQCGLYHNCAAFSTLAPDSTLRRLRIARQAGILFTE